MIQFASSVTRYFFRQKKCAILSGILLIGFILIGITDAQDAIRPADLKPEKDQVFFNQTDLQGWSAKDMDLWSVEEGAIVGTGGDAKIKGNQFLYSKIPVKNFRLKLKVKQVPYSANAGIQFRSTELKPSGKLWAIRRMLEKDGGGRYTTSMVGASWYEMGIPVRNMFTGKDGMITKSLQWIIEFGWR